MKTDLPQLFKLYEAVAVKVLGLELHTLETTATKVQSFLFHKSCQSLLPTFPALLKSTLRCLAKIPKVEKKNSLNHSCALRRLKPTENALYPCRHKMISSFDFAP